jgi:hypothetical protein
MRGNLYQKTVKLIPFSSIITLRNHCGWRFSIITLSTNINPENSFSERKGSSLGRSKKGFKFDKILMRR